MPRIHNPVGQRPVTSALSGKFLFSLITSRTSIKAHLPCFLPLHQADLTCLCLTRRTGRIRDFNLRTIACLSLHSVSITQTVGGKWEKMLNTKQTLAATLAFYDECFPPCLVMTKVKHSMLGMIFFCLIHTGARSKEEVKVPSMRQLHLHVISQGFDSKHLKHKKHWNSFKTEFFRDSVDVIEEVDKYGKALVSDESLLSKELRCQRCKSAHPTIPRLKAHISNCQVSFPETLLENGRLVQASAKTDVNG